MELDVSKHTAPWSRRGFLKGLAFAATTSGLMAAEPLAKLATVTDDVRRFAKDAPLRLMFKGGSAAELAAWQAQFAAELRTRLGPHQPPERWSSTRLSRVELSDHEREEWLLTAPGVASLPLYILKPAKERYGNGPFPIVMAVHGHGPFGHDAVVGIDDTPERQANIKGFNYDYGRQLVREGFLVVAPCLTPFGRRLDGDYADNPCAVTLVRLMLLGQTLMGANLRDLSWALSYAQTRSEARADAIGCVGLSLGGRMTMLAAALDPRIKVAVISGALNLMQERIEAKYACGAQVIPGLLEIGDVPEIGSLIAPRPCIWEIGSKDKLLGPKWVEAAKARLNKAYSAAGASTNLQFRHFEGGHEWDGTTAVPLLKSVLGKI